MNKKVVAVVISAIAFFMACTAFALRKEIKPYITASLPGVSQIDIQGKANNINSLNAQTIQDPEKNAEKLRLSGDFKGAVLYLDSLGAKVQTESSRKLRDQYFEDYKNEAVSKANQMIKAYDYKDAAELLAPVVGLQKGDDKNLENLFLTCTNFGILETYNGTVEHLFFHPLIAYPELAFDGDGMQKGFDNFFVTVPEFKEIIKQLYARNYILIDIRLLYHIDENGTVIKPELRIPKGKKPLVLSVDDLNFYHYMRGNGMVHGFAMNESGKIVTYTDMKDGTRTYSDDKEIVPILEKFIEEHPDFSYGGARGIIASTGYEGTLGFRTDETNASNYNEICAQAKQIADKLKEMGWIFACHSYGHNSPSKRTEEQMQRDCDQWIEETRPILGETDIYIFPFGELIKDTDPKFRYLQSKGYHMFCGVQKTPYIKYHSSYVLQQRRNVDGIALKSSNRITDMLDVSKILDPRRPKD
ncbi:MAG: hypothetical protein N2Z65_05750 [Clostridiales bacterium]|nr:hypothetical protein [Clostridiales bacterium]